MADITLQPGVYWVDSYQRSGRWPYNDWRSVNAYRVTNRRIVPHHSESPKREWILFEVSAPVVWTPKEAAGAGRPTVAPKGNQTWEDDTRDRPDLPQGRSVSDWLGGLGYANSILLIVGIAYLMDRNRRRK